MKGRKAQASVEFLVMLAAGLAMLAMVIFAFSGGLATLGIQKEDGETISGMSALVSAIEEVHSQGEGASRVVSLTLPGSYDPLHSGVVNSTVLIKTRGTTRAESFRFPVLGQMPDASGVQQLTVISRGGSVLIGNPLIFLDRYAISAAMPASSSMSRNFTVRNLAGSNASIIRALAWAGTGLNVSVSELNFTLAPYESRNISVTFNSSNVTSTFSGILTLDAQSGALRDSQAVYLYIEITNK